MENSSTHFRRARLGRCEVRVSGITPTQTGVGLPFDLGAHGRKVVSGAAGYAGPTRAPRTFLPKHRLL
jgi:hypothetical protein